MKFEKANCSDLEWSMEGEKGDKRASEVEASNENDENPAVPIVIGVRTIFPTVIYTATFFAGVNSQNDIQNSSNPLPDPLQEPSAEQGNNESSSNPKNGNDELVSVSCLLCMNIVHLNWNWENPAVINLRKEMLQNFVNHAGIDSNTFQLPDQCINTQFPLCNGCQQMLECMWNIAHARSSVNSLLEKISANVRDKWIANRNSFFCNRLTSPVETEKFYQLPNEILNLYRKNVILGRIKQEQMDWSEGIAPYDSDITADNQENINPVVTAFVNSYENVEYAEDNEGFENPISGWKTEENDELIMPIRITNVEGGVGLGLTQSPNLFTSNETGAERQVEYKDTVSVPSEDERNQEERQHNSNSNDKFGSLEIQKRKKRLFEKGVEIFLVLDKKKRAFYQCSVCNDMIPVQKKRGRNTTTSLADMKAHIRSKHTKQVKHCRPVNTRARQGFHKCRNCLQSFGSQNDVHDHIREGCESPCGILIRRLRNNFKICPNGSKQSRFIFKRDTSKVQRGSTSKRMTCGDCSDNVVVGRKHLGIHRRYHKTKGAKPINWKNH